MGDSSALLTPVIGDSGDPTPIVTPRDVSYNPYTLKSTQVDLTWTQVDLSPNSIRRFFRGYRIQVGLWLFKLWVAVDTKRNIYILLLILEQ